MLSSLKAMAEKRRTNRIHRQYYAELIIEGKPVGYKVSIQNLSSSGMFFLYEKQLVEGSRVNAKISFPPSDDPIQIEGQVIRSSPSGSSFYATALAFFDISEKHAALIDKFANLWFPPKH